VCVGAQCRNQTQDGGETDVDCGGADCAPCENGSVCAIAGDCISGYCEALACAACDDDNQCAPTEFCDLSAGVCEDKLPKGASCDRDEQCINGDCNNGSNKCS
jgi:hypothetical protein